MPPSFPDNGTVPGGDEAAFAAVTPQDVPARGTFARPAGVFVVGTGDHTYGPRGRSTYGAAKRAGMGVLPVPLPGGHSRQVRRAGLVTPLPHLARQTGLIP
ncbi:hypothetical protein [Streptomyces sp. NPDC101393]|uniref:hypothetical protein n=1 Tax=Streptomyces sp. NPDC101393 TaxID=3366141 RepID=UPI00381B2419